MAEQDNDVLVLTSEIVSAYLSHNSLRAEQVPDLIRTVRSSLQEASAPEAQAAAGPESPQTTKAQVRKSIQPDALISFVDGKPYKTLKRHLTRHGMTHNEYKAKYGLPNDYPSVSSDYSARRSEMAKSIGLGARGRGRSAPPPAPAKPARTSKAPARRDEVASAEG